MGYSLGFTAGALLYKESYVYIDSIQDFEKYLCKEETVLPDVIPTNSEAAKKRIKSELDKRLFQLDSEYLDFFRNSAGLDKKILLYLSVCKAYSIISEFALEVIYPKWKTFDFDVSTYDFGYFLAEKLRNNEINSISDKTKYKLSQVAIKIFKELGVLSNDKIVQIFPTSDLKNLLSKKGDAWIMNCLMIPNEIS